MSKTILKFTLAASIVLAGCASHPVPPPKSVSEPVSEPLYEPLNSAQCGGGEFRGVGVGTNEKEALGEAKVDLAKQIHSSIRVSEKYRQSQNVQNGKEILGSDFVSETRVEANLLNAQDARVLSVQQRAGEINAVVCMTKADAAKGFMERQRLVADSLEFAANASLEAKHPKRKNEAWQRTQTLWNKFARLQGMLNGFGVAKADYWESLNTTYTQAREAYLSYCKAQKFHWEDAGNECSEAAFSILSGKVKMEKAQCQSEAGLKLKLACSEKCTPSSFGGVECVFEPSLSVESCGGESYLLLKAQKPAMGRDMHNASKAKASLIEKLPSAEFLGEWEKELKGWMPLCAE